MEGEGSPASAGAAGAGCAPPFAFFSPPPPAAAAAAFLSFLLCFAPAGGADASAGATSGVDSTAGAGAAAGAAGLESAPVFAAFSFFLVETSATRSAFGAFSRSKAMGEGAPVVPTMAGMFWI